MQTAPGRHESPLISSCWVVAAARNITTVQEEPFQVNTSLMYVSSVLLIVLT